MSATIGGSHVVRARTWSRHSASSVAETTQIGDGPHVRRPRQSRPNPPYPAISRRLLNAMEQRLRTFPLRHAALMRKLRLQRSLDFYSGLRGSHAGPATVFGYHPAASVEQPVFGNWYGLGTVHYQDGEEEDQEQEVEQEQGRRHWEPAQLHFQQYLGQRHRHHQQPARFFSLSLDRNRAGDLKLVCGWLCGWGLKETLRLALNEVFHLFHCN